MAIDKEKKNEALKVTQRHEKDTGSAEAQISILTSRINQISEHLKVHKKDFGSRRGLLMLVGRRARLIRFLERTDKIRYQLVREKLKLK